MAELPPIPAWDEPPNWGRLPIEECGEPLVALSDGEGGLKIHALYAEMGAPGAKDVLYLRAGVRDRLFVAAESLRRDGAILVLFDGYRPLAVQQWLYDGFWRDAARERPELNDEALRAFVGQFVATPTSDPLRPPPHRSGGAADVYLLDAATGQTLPMGTEPDEASPDSSTHAFERTVREPFTANRRLLYHAMAAAGFANYHNEWWHFDYGNQRWANVCGAPNAIYGIPAEPD